MNKEQLSKGKCPEAKPLGLEKIMEEHCLIEPYLIGDEPYCGDCEACNSAKKAFKIGYAYGRQ